MESKQGHQTALVATVTVTNTHLQKVATSTKNVFEWTEKNLISLNLYLWVWDFLILWPNAKYTESTFALYWTMRAVLGKHIWGIVWAASWRTHLPMEHNFFLEEWQTHHDYSDLDLWKTFSQRLVKWVYHFEENNGPFCGWFYFKMKIRILEKLHLPPWQLLILPYFASENGVVLTNVIFWYYMLKCVNLWKICITPNFPYYQLWTYYES